MKRLIVLLCGLAALLCGCAEESGDTRAEELQRRCGEVNGYATTAYVTVADRDESRQYRLDVRHEGDETRLTVLEPEEIAGIVAVISGDALSLDFEGTVLAAGSAGTDLSAVNGADVVMRAAASGYITEQNYERYEGTDALRLCFETELNGETLYVTAYFDSEDRPLYAEIERQGDVLQYLEFTDFVFGDIVDAE